MKNAAAVADLLAVEWYSEQWPLIPKAELEASAVDFLMNVKMLHWQPERF